MRSLLENESGEKIRIILQEEKFLSQREEKKISHMICLLGRKMSGCKIHAGNLFHLKSLISV